MKRIFSFVVGVLLGGFVLTVWAQAPSAACEEQLNARLSQVGGLLQELASTREQLRISTKELNDLKTAKAAEPKK